MKPVVYMYLMSVVTQEIEADPSVRVVVMEGAGDKAFCAGGDIRGTLKCVNLGWSINQARSCFIMTGIFSP